MVMVAYLELCLVALTEIVNISMSVRYYMTKVVLTPAELVKLVVLHTKASTILLLP